MIAGVFGPTPRFVSLTLYGAESGQDLKRCFVRSVAAAREAPSVAVIRNAIATQETVRFFAFDA